MGRRFATAVLAAIALLLATGAPGALAQMQMDELKKMPPDERARLQTDLMKRKLDLNPAQTAQVGAINQKYAQQMQPILTGSEGPFMKMRQMREIGGAKEAELKQVLSPDQFQKYLAEREEMRQKFEEKLLQ
jgi:hypothetical protein